MNLNKNAIEEKIFAFLDSELSNSEEAELMYVLAKDQSARSIFKFYLKFKTASHGLESFIPFPRRMDDKIYRLLSTNKHRVSKVKKMSALKKFFWQQSFSLRPAWAIAACIILVTGTLLFSKILLTTRTQLKPIVNIENIDEIQQIRKHISKVKLTLDERVE